MTERQGAVMPTVWFLYSEDGEPLGQVYRREDESIPAEGTRITNGAKWKSVEVLSFTELTSTCAMRRFKVVVRLIE